MSPGITTAIQFGSDPTEIKLLVCSPCNISYSNNSGTQGQVYSGSTVDIANHVSMTFAPMSVFGIGPASQPTMSYRLDILYKREVRNP